MSAPSRAASSDSVHSAPHVEAKPDEGKLATGQKVTWSERGYKAGAVLAVGLAAVLVTCTVAFAIIGITALTSGLGLPVGLGLLAAAAVTAMAIFPCLILANFCMARAKEMREERLAKAS